MGVLRRGRGRKENPLKGILLRDLEKLGLGLGFGDEEGDLCKARKNEKREGFLIFGEEGVIWRGVCGG